MKKIISTLQKIDIRSVLICLIGAVMSRTAFLSMNPIAVGYFAAGYTYKKSRVFLILTMLAGLATTRSVSMTIKYGLTILVIAFITYLSEKQEKQLSVISIGVLSGLVTTAITLGNSMVASDYKKMIILAVLEGILAIITANILYLALDFIKNGTVKQLLTNQELISVSVLAGCLVYGMPSLRLYEFSVIEMAAYLLILFIGYKYGVGAGAVAGAACGTVLCLQNYNISLIGIFCILGITAGVFRELGKFAALIVFCVADIMLCYFHAADYLEVGQIRALVSALIIFILIPEKISRRIDLRSSEEAVKRERRNIQNIAQDRLSLFAESFQKLSKSFYNLAKTRSSLERTEMGDVLEKLTGKVCGNCRNCQKCWDTNYYNTKQLQEKVMETAKMQGYVKAGDFPKEFREQCISFRSFLTEANRELAVESVNLNWSNRMAESRLAVAGQLSEVAEIMDEFSKSLGDTTLVENQNTDVMKAFLKAYHIDVRKISVIEKRNKRNQLTMSLRTRKGRCITTREAAELVSKVYGRKLKPAADCKNVITKDYENIHFIEDTNFQTITGMAKVSKDGEKVSGDTFSFMNLENGETVMILSDGMGTGERAREESEIVIELLEQFLEAGFRECTAIKLINSILVLNSDYHTVSTLDISSIDLYTGMCNFVKIGASTTFIKRNGCIESIQSTNMPAGMFNEIDIEGSARKLYDGDYVIMVSDGMLDYLQGIDKEEEFKNLLMGITATNPQEMANEILNQISQTQNYEIRDDMTVLVAGFWEKI